MKRKLKNSELNRLTPEEFKASSKLPIVVVLDNIRSLNNIGSVFRTSDAFRVEEIHLCGITATPPHREIQKTALGATDSVSWKNFDQTIDSITFLKQEGYSIISVEQVEHGTMLNQFKVDIYKMAIVFGNEINGVSEDVIRQSDYCVEIPQFGTKHSFNIAVSAGIVLWHLYLQLADFKK
jgi:tRNA G18 (ribose-2'-O)-methylase SpoU